MKDINILSSLSDEDIKFISQAYKLYSKRAIEQELKKREENVEWLNTIQVGNCYYCTQFTNPNLFAVMKVTNVNFENISCHCIKFCPKTNEVTNYSAVFDRFAFKQWYADYLVPITDERWKLINEKLKEFDIEIDKLTTKFIEECKTELNN